MTKENQIIHTDKVKLPETVALNIPRQEQLTAYDDEFMIQRIDDGQDILVGGGLADGNYFIQCDYASFAALLDQKNVDITKLEEMFAQVGKLEKELPQFDEQTRKLIHACWRASRIVKNILGEVGSETKRNNSFSRFQTRDGNTGRKICQKPLSTCRNEAVCSEYTLLTHYILRRFGYDSTVIVGAFTDDPDNNLAGRHTFLTVENGNLIFDPTHSAQQQDNWPPKISKPDNAFTPETLRDMSTDENTQFGKKIRCTDLITGQVTLYGTGAV